MPTLREMLRKTKAKNRKGNSEMAKTSELRRFKEVLKERDELEEERDDLKDALVDIFDIVSPIVGDEEDEDEDVREIKPPEPRPAPKASMLAAFMGKRITVFCVNYIYTGDLVGGSDTDIVLENPAIVYETGAFTDPAWKDAQSLPNTLYIRLSAVESYGVVK